MDNSLFSFNAPQNEKVLPYVPGSAEKRELKATLSEMAVAHDIPVVIGGKEVRTGQTKKLKCPHNHNLDLGAYHVAGQKEIEAAVVAATQAKRDWEQLAWADRARIFAKAAALLAGPYRQKLNAATMLGQSKTCYQAEIDSACELIDFWTHHLYFMSKIYAEQPNSGPGFLDWVDHRPLEGFVFAITPFNFTSIGGNLPTAPAMMGNTVIWKPASTAVLSSYWILKILEEAGLPPGVINLVPGSGAVMGKVVLQDRNLAGVHFTGSTEVFDDIWRTVAGNLASYKSYPRLVGETGGKDFIFAHPACDEAALVTALVRGAFEYQGQKCSAASRAYIPKSIWGRVGEQLVETVRSLKMGDTNDFRTFMGAVIDEGSYKSISAYLEHAKASKDAKIIAGGTARSEQGWFIEPTVILAENPRYKTMEEEIFGPVLTVHVYDDKNLEQTLTLCDETSPYALTGAIFCRDRAEIARMSNRLRHAAGNFYINDKPTGAVVGCQPFGGARRSGTNDKAGSALNLLRWVSPRTIKETFTPATNYRYSYMDEE